MGILEWIVVFWVLGFSLGKATMSIDGGGHKEQVQRQCGFTRYPDHCLKTLSGLGNQQPHFEDIVSVLVNKTISETQLPISDIFPNFTSQFYVREDKHAKSQTGYCDDLMSMSLKRLQQSIVALKESHRKNKHDIQTWLSAAMTFQEACKDSTKEGLELSTEGDLQLVAHMDHLTRLASNSLALANRITWKSSNSSTNRHLNEVQDFPSWVSAKDRKLLQAPTMRANAVVAKDGTGNYMTVLEAIQAASGNRFVIYVKAGVYREKIKTNKDGITLIGDGKYATIIVNDDSVNGGASMPSSATFTITGDGFMARDIGFQNTAGPGGEQALALYVSSDHSVFYRCSIVGYQDTLYALALRQFYRECDISGTIDFIFGNAAVVLQNCNILFRRPRSGSSYNVILANGRTDPGQNTGFSLQNCRIGASSEFNAVKHGFRSYLGRPWKDYSRAIVMQSNIDDSIDSRGWVEWPGSGSGILKTLYFAEYANTGPGGGTSGRVNWPGHHFLGPPDAAKFTVRNFIAGHLWIPSTGVTFD
ncbi:pectinesterase [Tripterygium wilfordii]|uniref:Pectinesterase n=1 Tax=Tripterygium wilfordii TaxID=458696 RepID=A0A7J7D9V8_TRIWF|nr:pectinesterase-like [Tripterygium wilfordii]KAF5743132.1 pectinesterase [Tripterygium wilfordii]